MNDKAVIPPPPENEIWVSGDPNKIMEEMLLGIGRDYDCTVWLNGRKIHSATEVEGKDRPKAT